MIFLVISIQGNKYQKEWKNMPSDVQFFFKISPLPPARRGVNLENVYPGKRVK